MFIQAQKPPVAPTSSGRNVPVTAAPLARQQATSIDVPSGQASAAMRPKLLAVAAPGREDLVVLVDTSAMPLPINPPPSPEVEVGTSPTHRFLDREEATPQDERFCTQLWVLWAALTFPLVLSCWLLFLPVLLGKNRADVQSSPVFPLPPYSTGTLSVPTSTSNPQDTSRITQLTTTFPWQGVPAKCLQPVVPTSPPLPLKVGPYPNSTAAPDRRQRPIFCVFDNAKVADPNRATPQGWNYLFETLPFALCPNVVYASVGIVNGQLTSRAPLFDRDHGLHQLRNITETRGFPDTRIMLVLGGYQEDSPHFSRLGRDAATLKLLMKNVAEGMRNYRLDGVTVQWVTPLAECSGPDDMMVLAILLRRLRETFNSYGLLQHIVSVILVIKDGNELLMDSVADAVDYFFIGTIAVDYTGPGSYLDVCDFFTRTIRLVIAYYTKSTRRVRLDQLCITESLKPRAAEGIELYPSGSWIKTSPRLGSLPIYPACASSQFCRKDNGGSSCIAYLSYTEPGGATNRSTVVFLVPTADTLRSRVDFSGIDSSTGRPTSIHACVLVLGLDADNYANQCGQKYRQYVLMEHFYSGTLGQSTLGGSMSDAAPWCYIPQFG
ncbi:hypothetical protein HPB49_017539 [Dermacentor silvarum]|uniref:Uncharacterized protein n=1 Tax=Dermacentor silvarum TaxID=543639 RepID=A0ACB8C4Q9_DERSI|nr:hypothetical protein HPB49_017539 [Dermacentor silvarum]